MSSCASHCIFEGLLQKEGVAEFAKNFRSSPFNEVVHAQSEGPISLEILITKFTLYKIPQSMQTVRFSVQSSELGPLTLSPAYEYCSLPPLDPRGGDTMWRRGWWDPIQTLWYSIYVYYNLLYIYCFPAGNFILLRVPRILSINLLSQLPEDSRK